MTAQTTRSALADRLAPLAAALVTTVLGLAVHGAPSLPLADKLGDVLYATLVVLLLWALRPRTALVVLAAAGGTWCLAIELLQLTALPAGAAARLPLSRLVLGSGFDPLDLVAYAVGVILAASVVVVVGRTGGRGRRAG